MLLLRSTIGQPDDDDDVDMCPLCGFVPWSIPEGIPILSENSVDDDEEEISLEDLGVTE